VTHSSGEDFQCDIGDSGVVLKWPTQLVKILGVIWVNPVE